MDNNNNSDQDPWLARDKLYHFLFCFTLTVIFSALASCSRYLFLRTHSIRIGFILSLLAGAAKEVADHIGLFPSAGASFRDAVADVIGVLIASSALSLWRKFLDWPGGDSGRPDVFCPFEWMFRGVLCFSDWIGGVRLFLRWRREKVFGR